MSNKIYEGGYFNETQKLRYIDRLPEKSTYVSTRVLSRVKAIEKQYNEDLYNFDLDKIELLFHYLAPSTLNASRSNFYCVQNYIRWAIGENLRDNNIHPLDNFSDTEYFNKFVDQSFRTYYSKEEIDTITKTCINAQDSLPIQLLFEGAFGTSKYDELLNLTKYDVLEGRRLRLIDGTNERIIQVSERCIEPVNKALLENTYVKKNGNASKNLKSKEGASLVQNDYALRNVETRNKDDGKADAHLVLRRMSAVKGYNNLNTLTAIAIRNSGMLYMGKMMLDADGKLTKEHYEAISQQFGVKKIMNNGYEVYNYHKNRENFLNVDIIMQIYG